MIEELSYLGGPTLQEVFGLWFGELSTFSESVNQLWDNGSIMDQYIANNNQQSTILYMLDKL